MMKKVWPVLLAVVLVFGLAVLGCGSSGGGGGGDTSGGGALKVPEKLTLEENHYGDGYQAFVDVGATIKKDDEWTIDVKFTVSRDVPGGIQIGLVDTVTGYWNPLSYDGDAKDDEPNAIYNTGALVKDEEYTLKETFIALKDSGGTTKAHNRLVFQTEKEFSPKNDDSTTTDPTAPGPVTITFTGGSSGGGDNDFDALGDFDYNKGDNDSDGAESQAIWTITNADIKTALKNAEALVIVMENEIKGGTQFIWQSSTNWSGWHQKTITSNAGVPIEGVEFEKDDETGLYGLIINLSIIDDYSGFLVACNTPGATVKVILAYYTGATKIHELGIIGTILIPGEEIDLTPTITGVTVSPATVDVPKGGAQQFAATVTGTFDFVKTVTWKIDETGLATGTSISAAGLLTIATGETKTTLTVRATSTGDTTKSGTATVNVTNEIPKYTPTVLTVGTDNKISGADFTKIKDATSYSYLSIAYTPGSGNPAGAIGNLESNAGSANIQLMSKEGSTAQTILLLVSDVLPYAGTDNLYFNFWDGTCDSVTLFTAKAGLALTDVPEDFGLQYATTGATKVLPSPGGALAGKGDLPGLSAKAILDAADTAKLKIYFSAGKSGWGSGKVQVKDSDYNATDTSSDITPTGDPLTAEIVIGPIKTAYSGNTKATGFSINLYNDAEIIYMEIQP
jgi:hypothetical protein